MIDHEALLERVGVALAAQAEVTGKTAAARAVESRDLLSEGRILRARLRRQASLMRRLMSERRELQGCFNEPIGLVESALATSAADARADPRVANVRLPRDLSCSVVARRLVEDQLNGDFDRQSAADAVLVVSELVTNALVHGRGGIGLRAEIREDRLRLEVSDEGQPDSIAISERPDPRRGGLGLRLVDQLSTAWGAATRPTCVWVELSLIARSQSRG